ncbi:MAG: hypothetical protein M3N32_03905 [Actinomycetota bacterium]|nr:hypothetical protein [Actinomycetota bacterium]
MSRVTVYHLTMPARLPLIEKEGLRTRADLSDRFGPPASEDAAAPGRYAHGRRVSAYLSFEHARSQTRKLGPGLVSFTVDPDKVLAIPGSSRGDDPAAYWSAGRPLKDWLDEATTPEDLEVHQNVPVRAKYVRIHPALLEQQDLGDYAPLVEAVADADRLSGKALMHLAIVASNGDFASPEFLAAVALAWRAEPDPESLVRELLETGADKVASAALAEYAARAPEAAQRLRDTLEQTRASAEEQGVEPSRGLLMRSSGVLEGLATVDV